MRILVCSVILFSLNSRKACRAQDSTAFPAKWDLQTCLDYAKKNNIQIEKTLGLPGAAK